MAALENAKFQLQFSAKQLTRQAARAGAEAKKEKTRMDKYVAQGQEELAKIHAQNMVRKKNEQINLLKMGSQMDAVASRLESAINARKVTANLTKVVKGMEPALRSMDPERLSAVLDKFESQFEDIDVATGQYENATGSITATSVPQDEVDAALAKSRDAAGVTLNSDLNSTELVKTKVGPTEEEEAKLGDRLRALRA